LLQQVSKTCDESWLVGIAVRGAISKLDENGVI
jgi:hypothetical protein